MGLYIVYNIIFVMFMLKNFKFEFNKNIYPKTFTPCLKNQNILFYRKNNYIEVLQ